MRDTRWSGLGVVMVWGLCSSRMCTCVVHEKKNVGRMIVAQQERVWKGKELGKEKRRGKKGESGLRGMSVFLFLCDCVFHSILFSFSIHHTTTLFPTLSYTPLYSTPHHRTHNTPHKHACVLSSFFVCDSVPTQSTLNQTNNTTPCNHAIITHMVQPMDEAMGEWEWAVVIEDTTPQTPITTIKWWWHTLHLVSLVAWIGHAHSSLHLTLSLVFLW